ncbi:flagellar motor protein MotB [Cognatishimia sp. 1_MG-2023]|uniref:flagellar motor protein MotB n=1 Tax=Cognatishimia sp. 1_MG-2023 TaxID=3062642 RepID=UPI0026E1AD60|nr:flagellar motor protein MotB [Cognatishimia sp. 1_MG-2023]MDO6726916.1 flagellar motor protein MotB [Cognatishimia sp. 1_MG-2023]
MTAQSNVAPVIIKRKKVSGGDGHHGGAWKVAYADFVTAMMAFFMLMWLLNATTEKQRKGIADYFHPTIPINRISGGGEGSFGGESVFSSTILAKNGSGGVPPMPVSSSDPSGFNKSQPGGSVKGDDESGKQDEALQEVENFLLGNGGESFALENVFKHVATRQTDEGLIIELFDTADQSLFKQGESTPFPILVELARVITDAARLVGNDIAVEGHVASKPLVVADRQIWSLSSARADQMRRLLEAQGTANTRMSRITGHADRELVQDDPLSGRNNRLEIILLRQ